MKKKIKNFQSDDNYIRYDESLQKIVIDSDGFDLGEDSGRSSYVTATFENELNEKIKIWFQEKYGCFEFKKEDGTECDYDEHVKYIMPVNKYKNNDEGIELENDEYIMIRFEKESYKIEALNGHLYSKFKKEGK